MISVIDVKPLDNYILELIFNSNEKKHFDLKPYLEHGIFKELQDEKLYKTAFISFDTVEWANGADLCPEVLYKGSN